MKNFKDDHLGESFFVRELKMMPDFDGHVSANLIYHPCPNKASQKAVLYLHGFIDYFFQKEMAEQFADHGFHFFALDLRKCGRSLKDGEPNNYVNYLEEYFEEINEAVGIIKSEFTIDSLVLKGHSTGGLIAALYADQDKGKRIKALVLDSPFLDLNVPSFLKNVVLPFVGMFIRNNSKAQWRKGSPTKYLRDLHVDNGGEWDFNTQWKPYNNIPLFINWLLAVRAGQKQLHKGLAVKVPVVIMHSDKSYRIHMGANRTNSDVVLNVEHMKKYGLNIGRYVSFVEIEGAIHHLILSPKVVRDSVYNQMFKWLHNNLI